MWKQIGDLGLALGLTSLIGLEREWRHKPTGLRTHTLVGLGAALMVIVGKYGFSDVLGPSTALDPSRVAAQIVSGIGFIGGGLIFVRGDAVRGLTTAAIVWMTTAIGMACGAGLALVAVVATAGHFLVVVIYPILIEALPGARHVAFDVRVVYEDGRGILRNVLAYTRLSETSSRPMASSVDSQRGSLGATKCTSGMISSEASRTSESSAWTNAWRRSLQPRCMIHR